MNLAFSVTAAALAAACGWPAASLAATFAAAAGSPTAPDPASGLERAVVTRPARARVAVLTALITAALVLLATLRLHQELLASACGWLVVCGLPLSIVDIRVRRLPDALTAACAAGISVLLVAAAAVDGRWHELTSAGAGAAATCLFFALLAVARPGTAGLGDAKLGLSTGALAAWFGWGVLLTSMFTAFALAACYGVGLLVAGRASARGSSVPFGPFLVAGCLTVVLLAAG
ncbi:MAG TPA: A24 family peptidase [Streptosporangiaceae bacterium]|nr:A24 family peptidase [Streptosporangiaceae bacterium]